MGIGVFCGGYLRMAEQLRRIGFRDIVLEQHGCVCVAKLVWRAGYAAFFAILFPLIVKNEEVICLPSGPGKPGPFGGLIFASSLAKRGTAHTPLSVFGAFLFSHIKEKSERKIFLGNNEYVII